MSVFSIFQRFRSHDSNQNELNGVDVATTAETGGPYHARFISECRSGIGQIKANNEQVLARKLRDNVGGLCEALGKIVDQIQSDSSQLANTRALPGIIRLCCEMLQEYNRIFAVDDAAEREKRAAAAEAVESLRCDLNQMLADMQCRAKINLTALTRTLERLRRRDIEGQDVVPIFEENREEL